MSGTDVAAWSPDDAWLVSASGLGRELELWDVARGVVVDRLRLPVAEEAMTGELMRLTSLRFAPDGRTATLEGAVTDLTEGMAPRGRAYSVDLVARTVRLLPDPPAPDGGNAFELVAQWVAALETVYGGGEGMSRAEAEALLPRLPKSNDGRLSLRRHERGFEIVADGQAPRLLAPGFGLGLDDAALAPDGKRLGLLHAAIDREDGREITRLDIFDTLASCFGPQLKLPGDYEAVRWLDATRLLATSTTSLDDRDSTDPSAQGLPPAELLIDAATGQMIASVPPRCFTTPLPDGGLVGAGLANCRPGAGDDRGLARFDPATGEWRSLEAFPLAADAHVGLIAVAPAGDVLAVSSRAPDAPCIVSIVDAKDGSVRMTRGFSVGGEMTHLAFSADGKSLLVAENGRMGLWWIEEDRLLALAQIVALPSMFVTDGRTGLVSGPGEDGIARFDMASGAALEPLDYAGAGAGGFLPGRPIFWAASALNGLRYWDTKDWSELLTVHVFENQGFVAVTPEGRYDTNLGPDAARFRWLMSDAPFQSLPPQTFMRDYFEPRLAQRLFDCTTARDCESVLKPLPALAELNRVLPNVRISDVRRGATAAEAIVAVEAQEGEDPRAANGKTRSGVFNLRLFRNGRFVAQAPDEPAGARQDLESWRRLNRAPEPDRGGVHHWEFVIPLPTGEGSEQQVFSAYAFNEDRVKSDTASFAWSRPPAAPRRPRAFVVTIGIDAYDEARLALQFAGADAQLLGDRLEAIPGFETRRVTLASRKRPGSDPPRVTRAAMRDLLGILAGSDRDFSLAALAAIGVDASPLDRSTPDDVVILTFSGHGWADRSGNFHLVPADAAWPDPVVDPDPASLVSSADLSDWLRPVQSADIAFVIDACHSAASVEAGGFKPGPMGDAGLGQLAFDKGIRILAATQADDLAFEDPVLRQGLLTYALAGEGITETGGKADLDGDGRIRLDEWLLYASRRLPSLSEDVRVGRFTGPASGGRGFVLLDGGPARRPRVQEPALFDFTGGPSAVVLRELGR